jgi:hypothetical protein
LDNIVKIKYLFIIILLISKAAIAGEPALYGIKSGDSVDSVIKIYGKAKTIIPFEDGWTTYVFQFLKHNLIIETSSGESDYVSTVQIQGIENPEGKGFNGINLGAAKNQVTKIFGQPTEKRESVDTKTQEKIPNAFIYQYQTFSFEIIDNKVTSIKLHFPNRIRVILSNSVIKPDGLLEYTYNNLTKMVNNDHQCAQFKLLNVSNGKINERGVITETWDVDACGKKAVYVPILVPDSQNGYLVSFGKK